MGKLIVIEGTDCSGKQTQAELLITRLNNANHNTQLFGFPNYNSPTGKIIAGPYLGKPDYGNSYFAEGASNVDPKVAGFYYSADRLYNKNHLLETLKTSHLILDRYVESNLAHQGGKITNKKQRLELYNWFINLEYYLIKLPQPDIKVLLYMPRQFAAELKAKRKELPDDHEKNEDYLLLAEKAYLEVATLRDFKIIHCVKDNKIRTIEDINNELYEYVLSHL